MASGTCNSFRALTMSPLAVARPYLFSIHTTTSPQHSPKTTLSNAYHMPSQLLVESHPGPTTPLRRMNASGLRFIGRECAGQLPRNEAYRGQELPMHGGNHKCPSLIVARRSPVEAAANQTSKFRFSLLPLALGIGGQWDPRCWASKVQIYCAVPCEEFAAGPDDQGRIGVPDVQMQRRMHVEAGTTGH